MEQLFLPYEPAVLAGRGAVLVLAPHPDDEVFGCGGALARHADAGDPITVVIATDGAYGPQQPADYALQRRAESSDAASILGYGTPRFWDYPDRGLEYGESLIGKITACLEEQPIALLYAPSRWEMHPDHRALAMAAAEAVRRCPYELDLVMYEVGVPLHPNALLDITDIRERKQAAMDCFVSQLCQQRYDRHIRALNEFRTYTLGPDVLAAEAFRLISRADLRADPVTALMADTYAAVSPILCDTTHPPPLVSVIVRCRTGSLPLATLASVELQTYPHIEVCLVNVDGMGPTLSGEVRRRFPVRCLAPEELVSIVPATNTAMEHAAGEFLMIVDDGDQLSPDCVAALTEALRGRQHDRRVVYGGAALRGAGSLDGEAPVFNAPFDLARLRRTPCIALGAVLFERSFIETGVRFDERLGTLADWDFCLQLAEQTAFWSVDRVIVTRSGGPDLPASMQGITGSAARGRLYDKWRESWGGAAWAEILGNAEQETEDQLRKLSVLLDARESECAAQRDRIATVERWCAEKDRVMAELRVQLASSMAEQERLRQSLPN